MISLGLRRVRARRAAAAVRGQIERRRLAFARDGVARRAFRSRGRERAAPLASSRRGRAEGVGSVAFDAAAASLSGALFAYAEVTSDPATSPTSTMPRVFPACIGNRVRAVLAVAVRRRARSEFAVEARSVCERVTRARVPFAFRVRRVVERVKAPSGARSTASRSRWDFARARAFERVFIARARPWRRAEWSAFGRRPETVVDETKRDDGS